MTIVRNIGLQERRCWSCGRFYAVETELTATCPYCAERRADERRVEMETMRRSMAALRGALTKAKARR